MWFIESHTVLLFVYLLFVFEIKVYSYPVKQTKIIFYQKEKRK